LPSPFLAIVANHRLVRCLFFGVEDDWTPIEVSNFSAD